MAVAVVADAVADVAGINVQHETQCASLTHEGFFWSRYMCDEYRLTDGSLSGYRLSHTGMTWYQFETGDSRILRLVFLRELTPLPAMPVFAI